MLENPNVPAGIFSLAGLFLLETEGELEQEVAPTLGTRGRNVNVGGEDDTDSDDDLQEKLDDGENTGDFGIETLIMFAF